MYLLIISKYYKYINASLHLLPVLYGITFYSYTHVPYRNITHQHANMLEEKESWIMYSYKKSNVRDISCFRQVIVTTLHLFQGWLKKQGHNVVADWKRR